MKNYKFFNCFVGIVVLLLTLISCDDGLGGKLFLTDDAITITKTLESDERFSMYVEILEKTKLYTALDSYGEYSCLAPTNDAITEFISEKWDVKTIGELNTQEQLDFLDILVKFHTISNDREASSFIEGRITDTTYTGDFITTSFIEGGGVSNVLINNKAHLVEFDISALNGIIHGIDAVLDPYELAVPGTMEAAGTHTVFVEALKQTGYFDLFSLIRSDIGKKLNVTILAESDELFSSEGINSFEDLANKYSPSNSDYTNLDNGLNKFIAYHASYTFTYTADYKTESDIVTTTLLNGAMTTDKTTSALRINYNKFEDTWNTLIVAESNKPAKNGVYHSLSKILDVFTPPSEYVFYDIVSDQDEVTDIPTHTPVFPDAWDRLYWFPENEVRYLRQNSNANWKHTVFDIANVVYMEFITPIIPVGKYELLISGNGGNGARAAFQIEWDGEPIGSVYDMRKKFSDEEYRDPIFMENAGWRRGYDWNGLYANNNGLTAADLTNVGRFIVTKELVCPVQTTHVIRLKTLKSGNSPLDFIEWIPVEE